jgi:hypothetical protein
MANGNLSLEEFISLKFSIFVRIAVGYLVSNPLAKPPDGVFIPKVVLDHSSINFSTTALTRCPANTYS